MTLSKLLRLINNGNKICNNNKRTSFTLFCTYSHEDNVINQFKHNQTKIHSNNNNNNNSQNQNKKNNATPEETRSENEGETTETKFKQSETNSTKKFAEDSDKRTKFADDLNRTKYAVDLNKTKLTDEINATKFAAIVSRTKLLNDSSIGGMLNDLKTGTYLNDTTRRLKLSERIVELSPVALRPYLKLARYDKPIGSWLLFWPCGWSIASASDIGSMPDLYLLMLFGAGSFVMRGAGCTINDMWDRDIDRKVERTSNRPLVNGDLTMTNAWRFLAVQLTVGLTILLQLNWYSVALGASSMLLVVTYPLMKRVTYWPQLMLGLTFNWGALLGYGAVKNYVDLSICLPLYLAGVCWTIFYDTIYAHQDRRDDLRIGIKSTAIKFGSSTKYWLAGFGATMMNGLLVSGIMNEQTWPYYVSLTLIGTHLVGQLYTLDVNDPTNCGERFVSNAYVGLVLFIGIVLGNFVKKRDDEGEATESSDTSRDDGVRFSSKRECR